MPSPFPGMDPFLEQPRWFPTFHDNFITYIQEALQPSLPSPYYAVSNQRVWGELFGRKVSPDVGVGVSEGDPLRRFPDSGGGVALANRALTRPVVVSVSEEPRRETYLEILTGGEDGDRLVTSVELLSLANKSVGEKNRGQYLQKQQEFLSSRVNLVEIDLLRSGLHTTAVPLETAVARCGGFDYHVCVHRFDRPQDFFVYPISLREPLPAVEVPLSPGDDAVVLDLQSVFQRTYDMGPYRRMVAYQTELPEPPLTDEQARWADEWLRNGM